MIETLAEARKPGSGRLFVVLAAGLLALALAAAATPASWIEQAMGDQSMGLGVTADAAGNSYATGSCQGDLLFSAQPVVNPHGAEASSDFFLVSHDREGALRWAAREGGVGDEVGLRILAGRTGVYVAGWYQGAARFAGETLPAAPGRSLFLAKYSFAGARLWTRTIEGGGRMHPRGLAVDASERVYLFGSFEKFADFGKTRLAAAMAKNLFLARYSAEGDFDWAQRITGGNSSITGPWARGIAVAPDGAVVLAIQTAGENRLGALRHVTSETRYGPRHAIADPEIVIAFCSPEGEFRAVKRIAAFAEVEAIAMDPAGRLFVTGAFKGRNSGNQRGAADFGGTKITTHPGADGRPSEDVFLACYDSALALAWVRRAGGPADDRALGLALAPGGEVALTGYFCETAAFGNRTLGASRKPTAFLAVYEARGELLFAEQGGGEGSCRGEAVAGAGEGRILVTGSFSGQKASFAGHRLTSGRQPRMYLFSASPPAAGHANRSGDR